MKILIHDENPEPLAKQLEQAHAGHEIKTCNNYEDMPALIAEFTPDAVFTVRFAGTPGFPTEALTGPGGPRWIHVGGSGTDHLGTWDTQHTIVTNSAGVAAFAMAEYAIGSMLHFSLDVPGLIKDQASQVWAKRSISVLRGKTVLIIGLGNVGQAVARLASALGMYVIGTRATPRDTPFVDEVHGNEALDLQLARADYVVVSVPLYDATRGLLGRDAITKTKKGSVLVNLSRGGIVCEKALLEALSNGRLRGAALDVFETEPLPPDSPFWTQDNVLVSPHCSGVFEGWEAASMDIFCRNLTSFENGETMENTVLPK